MSFTQQIFTDDDNRQAGRADVFLCSGINYAITANVKRCGKNGRGQISRDHNVAGKIRCFIDRNAIDSFVRTIVQVRRVIRKLPFTHRLNSTQAVNADFGINNVWRAVFFRFFNCTGGPITGIDVIRGGFITQNI